MKNDVWDRKIGRVLLFTEKIIIFFDPAVFSDWLESVAIIFFGVSCSVDNDV